MYATWDLSYNAFIKSFKMNALWILKTFAFFHNENIAIDISEFAAQDPERSISFKGDNHLQDEYSNLNPFSPNFFRLSSNGEWDRFAFRQSIYVLPRLSLIHQDESWRYDSMHRLVRDWLYDDWEMKDKIKHFYGNSCLIAISTNEGLFVVCYFRT